MKNLKKLLAMVLVVVLAFGLMATVSAANVSDYSDADDVTYTEAVDLFTALGFLQGMGDNTFDPQGLVTREQAAKIITYMLIGSVKADALTTMVSSFSDVAVDRWSAPYIEYCAALGIINGNGDGTFDPAGNVTGAQFAKMLLCAIGYGVNDEYTGANWAMKTIADATSLGILSLDLDFSAAAAREEVSQYGFNAYTKCNTVVYNSTTHAYQQATNIDGVNAKGSLATQQNVNNTTSTYTANGTTYYRWTKGGVEMTGGYTKEKVIGTNTMGLPLSMLTDSSSAFYIATLDTTVAYYYNGTVLGQYADGAAGVTLAVGAAYYNTTVNKVMTAAVANTINSAGDTDVLAAGVIVNLVNTDSDAKAETVQVIKKAVAVLSGDPIVSNNMVTISAISGLASVSAVKVPGYDTLKDKDVVLWYKNTTTGTYYIDKAESVSGTVASYVNTTSVTLGGATYKYSGLGFPGSFTNTSVNSWAGLTDTTLYLDDGGYVCYGAQAVVTNPAAAYAFVTNVDTAAFVTSAKIILSDGTSKTVTLDSTSALNGSGAATPNAFYKFAVTTDGNYVLTALVAPATTVTLGASVNITKTTVNYSSAATDHPANSKTRFVYEQVTSAAGATALYAYTGVANVPNFTGTAATTAYELTDGTNAVFVIAISPFGTSAFTPSTTTGDWVYIMSANRTVEYVSASLTTYTYQAMVNGTVGTVTVASSKDAATFNGNVGLYMVTGYDSNGYVTIATASGSTTPASFHACLGADNLTASGGNITADGTNYKVLNSSAKIYYIDTTAANTTGVIAYEISATQATELASIGYVVDFVQTSGTDTSISTVYVYRPITLPTYTSAQTVTPTDGNAGGLTATVVLQSLTGTTATYKVTISGADLAGGTASTLLLTAADVNVKWTSVSDGTTMSITTSATANDELTIATGADYSTTSVTATYTVELSGNGTPSAAITVNDVA